MNFWVFNQELEFYAVVNEIFIFFLEISDEAEDILWWWMGCWILIKDEQFIC